MEHTEAGASFTDLLLEVFRFNGALLAEGDRITAQFGLTSARWQIMGMIDDGPLPVPHIARMIGLTRQGVQRTVNVLDGEGLIELQENPHHKKAKLVQLSPEGRRRLEQTKIAQAAWANDVAAEMSPTELDNALILLRRLRTKIEGN